MLIFLLGKEKHRIELCVGAMWIINLFFTFSGLDVPWGDNKAVLCTHPLLAAYTVLHATGFMFSLSKAYFWLFSQPIRLHT